MAPRLGSFLTDTDLDLTYWSSLSANSVRGLSRVLALLFPLSVSLDSRRPSTDPALVRGCVVDLARLVSSRGSFVDSAMARGRVAVPALPNLSRGSFSGSSVASARLSPRAFPAASLSFVSLPLLSSPLTVSSCRRVSFLSITPSLAWLLTLTLSLELLFPPVSVLLPLFLCALM